MIGTTDIATGKVFTFNMGDIYNQIQYTYGQSINILGKYGCQINCGAGSSMLIGSTADPRVSLLQDIVMHR